MTQKKRGLQAWAMTFLASVALTMTAVVGAAPAEAATPLIGTFQLTPGSCAGGHVSGTYLRMILPSGSPSGPYMSNSDSTCSDQSFTPLQPGTDGGLVSGSYQPTPNPPFDSSGNALAGRITAPAQFYGTSFATSSNATDPQTGHSAPPPTVYASGNQLTANLAAFSVTWNKQYFNQGSPKPNGTYPGNTRQATGTYDAATGAFTLNWTSQVVGGPFDKFTGQWHLTGHFVPAGRSTSHSVGQSTTQTTASGTGATSTRTGTSTSAGAPAATAKRAHSTTAPIASAVAPLAAAPAAASTTTVVTDRWHTDWWIIALAAAIAMVGFLALALLSRSGRSKSTAA